MKILILSNWSTGIAVLNSITEPNKAAYAEKHGYSFENVKVAYGESHLTMLETIAKRIEEYDVVMTIGCDAIFVNQSIRIESRINDGMEEVVGEENTFRCVPMADKSVVLAKDLTCCWPIQINNDVMIWPAGPSSETLIRRLLEDEPIWSKYPQLWQNHLWNLIQSECKDLVRLVEPRLMNSTFQPMTRAIIENADGSKSSRLTRIPGISSYALGDWIFHALDMPMGDKLEIIKWAMQYVGDGTWTPDQDKIAQRIQL